MKIILAISLVLVVMAAGWMSSALSAIMPSGFGWVACTFSPSIFMGLSWAIGLSDAPPKYALKIMISEAGLMLMSVVLSRNTFLGFFDELFLYSIGALNFVAFFIFLRVLLGIPGNNEDEDIAGQAEAEATSKEARGNWLKSEMGLGS